MLSRLNINTTSPAVGHASDIVASGIVAPGIGAVVVSIITEVRA